MDEKRGHCKICQKAGPIAHVLHGLSLLREQEQSSPSNQRSPFLSTFPSKSFLIESFEVSKAQTFNRPDPMGSLKKVGRGSFQQGTPIFFVFVLLTGLPITNTHTHTHTEKAECHQKKPTPKEYLSTVSVFQTQGLARIGCKSGVRRETSACKQSFEQMRLRTEAISEGN